MTRQQQEPSRGAYTPLSVDGEVERPPVARRAVVASDRRPGRLALGAASALALTFAWPALRAAVENGGTSGIHIGHGETLSLTTYGRWWVWPPHHFMTDAFSGDLATFYNFLSDSLLNLGAALTGQFPITLQAFFYGPLLGFLFVWLGYRSLTPVLGDRWTAAIAAAIAGFTVDPGLDRLVLGRDAATASSASFMSLSMRSVSETASPWAGSCSFP